MDFDSVIQIAKDDSVVFETVDNDCCVYIGNRDEASVLNATAACVFLYLYNMAESGCSSITFGNVMEEVTARFRIPPDMMDRASCEITQLLCGFRDAQLLVKLIQTGPRSEASHL
jgi:hypothetical protein